MRKMKNSWKACAGAALAVLSASALADDTWVYDTSKREPVVPTSAEVTVVGLDAKARGLSESTIDMIDKWCWSWMYSNAYDVDFGRVGSLLLFR